jgi:hypothetical protein
MIKSDGNHIGSPFLLGEGDLVALQAPALIVEAGLGGGASIGSAG